MAVEALSVELEEEEPPSFCKNVGWGGVGLYALALLVGGVHLYIAAEYTYFFRDMHTEHVWVFFTFASLYLLLVVLHCLTWKSNDEITYCRPQMWHMRDRGPLLAISSAWR